MRPRGLPKHMEEAEQQDKPGAGPQGIEPNRADSHAHTPHCFVALDLVRGYGGAREALLEALGGARGPKRDLGRGEHKGAIKNRAGRVVRLWSLAFP